LSGCLLGLNVSQAVRPPGARCRPLGVRYPAAVLLRLLASGLYKDRGVMLMIALPHIPIGAVDCVADEFKIFDTLPVLWQFRPAEVMLPPPPCETPPTDFGFDSGMSPYLKRADGR
jgi:hypothetical protein